ncbi:unnamed protein product [Adineta ricciae]|uniref:Uncharacterized protein n=1 Tax=Adineta ricciae TaxID=249248 RepID=A0A815PYA9_ADIRI|nr:unnamed protein product [Adineta ricciae]CAF1587127.1 unnamed protein product [Adineta ricciae]
MFFLHILFYLTYSSSTIVSLRINLALVNLNRSTDTTQHNCLYVTVPNKGKRDFYEIIPYCMHEWHDEDYDHKQIFTFADLYKQHITSNDLYHWSASVDVIEEYQWYLNRLDMFGDASLATRKYYNCTLPQFGRMCQYSFLNFQSSFSSLNEILDDFYTDKSYVQLGIICYTGLQCKIGSVSFCLDWNHICDKINQCSDGSDELNCWQLEIHRCKSNEFQCQDGSCIPLEFFNDDPLVPDCLDASDERNFGGAFYYETMLPPAFAYEDVVCKVKVFEYLVLSSRSCVRLMIGKSMEYIFSEKEPSMPDICWSALKCQLRLPDGDPRCANICIRSESCELLIEEHCPNRFFMPAIPIHSGHIYLAYEKANIDYSFAMKNAPDYVCYDEHLCEGIPVLGDSFIFNNVTCRSPRDLYIKFPTRPQQLPWNEAYPYAVSRVLGKCQTLFVNDSISCDRKFVYQCQNSSKCVPIMRRYNGKRDCKHGDDEYPILNNVTSCPIDLSDVLFYCVMDRKCIHRTKVSDGQCDCTQDHNGFCDDEHLGESYHIARHISFPAICDGFTELRLISTDGERNDNDETECEQWACNNIYTRCNNIWNCPNGADEVGCYSSLPLNCSVDQQICLSSNSNLPICITSNKINNGQVDCLWGIDEPVLCRTQEFLVDKVKFYCKKLIDTRCVFERYVCNEDERCAHGNLIRFCNHTRNLSLGKSICVDDYHAIRSDSEQYLCKAVNRSRQSRHIHFALDQIQSSFVKSNVSTLLQQTTKNFRQPLHCFRGFPLQIWPGDKTNAAKLTCLCPPSYHGNQCQYQSQRVSLTMRFQAYSDSWKIPFLIIITLIDNTFQRTIHSHHQLTFVYTQDCKRKFNIYLTYLTQPKNESNRYSIHIDIFEKISLFYRGSLLIRLPFSFLPVERVATQLHIPYQNDQTMFCFDSQCVHGRCVRYFNDPDDSTFCQCNLGWSGRYCTIEYDSTCSSKASDIGLLANKRSLCVCPLNKWGPRCLLDDDTCQQNRTCENNGQCIPKNEYSLSTRTFTCICPDGFLGETCEISQSKLSLTFHNDIQLPQSMIVHFIQIVSHSEPENGTTFKAIPLDRQSVVVYWTRPYHIAFVELFTNNYYLITVRSIPDSSSTLEKTLTPSDRCIHIKEYFNETFSQLHLIRRIKYYHLPCQQRTRNISCFYDDNHFCLCNDFQNQRLANCMDFNHTLKRDCRGRSTCQNGGQCLEDSITCPQVAMCICTTCFFGTYCQFTTSGFSLSLDGILGYHIRPYINIVQQPAIVKFSIGFALVLAISGVINSILTMITFSKKDERDIGCGSYLLVSSIVTFFTMIIVSLKFWILLDAQMTYKTDRTYLELQCRTLDFLVRTGLNMDQWLNACVSIERVFMAIKGVSFNKQKSKKAAKYIILVLIIVNIGTHLQEPIYRRLLDEDTNDEKRLWCIVTYSSAIEKFNLGVDIFHFVSPFLINLMAAIVIIYTTARLKKSTQTHESYRTVLRKQFQQHKNLLIAPCILILLALPRLIISLVSGCMKSARDSWLFLIGYFISFIPSLLTFAIFVAPSKVYKEKFNKTVKAYQRTIRSRFGL